MVTISGGSSFGKNFKRDSGGDILVAGGMAHGRGVGGSLKMFSGPSMYGQSSGFVNIGSANAQTNVGTSGKVNGEFLMQQQ